MSQGLSYQSLLSDTIMDFVLQKKLTIDQILVQAIESLMQSERRIFLATAECLSATRVNNW